MINKTYNRNKGRNKNWNKSIIKTIFFLFLLSSQNAFSQEKEPLRSSITPRPPVEECRKLILEKGDTTAYYGLFWTLAREKREADYFFYSLFMTEKYNYEKAYDWVYWSANFFCEENKIPFEGKILDFVLECLMKGAELGISGAQIKLRELYEEGKYVPQDTIKGAELRAKGRRQ